MQAKTQKPACHLPEFMLTLKTMERATKHNKDKRIATGLNSFAASALPLLKGMLGKQGFAAADILVFWEQIAGPEIAAYTLPRQLLFKRGKNDGGTLEVLVPGGAFALELQHRQAFIVEKINSYFGYKAVAEIKLVQDLGLLQRRQKQINQPQHKKTLVSSEEQNYIENASAGIEDANLKANLQRLGRSIFSENHKSDEIK